jgi:hypothetical protein
MRRAFSSHFRLFQIKGDPFRESRDPRMNGRGLEGTIGAFYEIDSDLNILFYYIYILSTA